MMHGKSNIKFYKLYLLPHKFPVLTNRARQISLFGSVYICGQFFLKANTLKNPYTNPLDGGRCENDPRVSSSQIYPDMNTDVTRKQCHFSY